MICCLIALAEPLKGHSQTEEMACNGMWAAPRLLKVLRWMI